MIALTYNRLYNPLFAWKALCFLFQTLWINIENIKRLKYSLPAPIHNFTFRPGHGMFMVIIRARVSTGARVQDIPSKSSLYINHRSPIKARVGAHCITPRQVNTAEERAIIVPVWNRVLSFLYYLHSTSSLL